MTKLSEEGLGGRIYQVLPPVHLFILNFPHIRHLPERFHPLIADSFDDFQVFHEAEGADAALGDDGIGQAFADAGQGHQLLPGGGVQVEAPEIAGNGARGCDGERQGSRLKAMQVVDLYLLGYH